MSGAPHHTLDLRLTDVDLFVRIVELGSLSAAARERDVPVSQVTRSLARLEAACGARLLHRTTHSLSLTDEGEAMRLQARRLLETSSELQAELSGRRGGPGGWVRLSVSPILAQTIIAPSLVSLCDRHPALHVDIQAEDRIVDMAREGIDVAIRTGTPASEQLVAREIGTLTRSLYASPAYLRRHGQPRRPEDLQRHRLVQSNANPAHNRWQFAADGGVEDLAVQGHTRSDNSAVLLSLVASGVGIGRIIDVAARPLVAAGTLVPLLQQRVHVTPVPMFAVMLHERHRLPKIRACIDHWAAWMAGGPATLTSLLPEGAP